jgi:GntR family transcriptional regulator, transcriptional repressor for pyruvate dehydrogenase complex
MVRIEDLGLEIVNREKRAGCWTVVRELPRVSKSVLVGAMMPTESSAIIRICHDLPHTLAPTTPQVVTDRLRGLIHRGELGPGDRLPPERVLADELGIARVSLREALAQLQQEGYLVARRGALGGTFVTELVEPRRRWLLRMRDNFADLEGIIDYRVAVEGHAARLAAARRSTPDLRAMDDAVRQLCGATGVISFRAADNAFHHAVAAAARSPRVQAAINEARGLLFMPTDALVYPPDIGQSLGDHRRIAAAIRDGHGEEATAAMREHIESTRDWLRGVLTEPGAASVGEPTRRPRT